MGAGGTCTLAARADLHAYHLGDGDECNAQQGRMLVKLLLNIHCMCKGEVKSWRAVASWQPGNQFVS